MVKGLQKFKAWFSGFEEQYAIIGGTACDLLFTESGLAFRATRDIDMVLIIESISPDFVSRFWEYIKEAGYEHKSKSTGKAQFYRFSHPKNDGHPFMIELFSRQMEAFPLPQNAVLTPLPFDTELSSLSAILLNSDYYEILKNGRMILDGVPILDAAHLIPFKAKAWLDLSKRKAAGEDIDTKTIRKHRNDVFRLSVLLSPETRVELPMSIRNDISEFINAMLVETIDLKTLAVPFDSKEMVLAAIASACQI